MLSVCGQCTDVCDVHGNSGILLLESLSCLPGFTQLTSQQLL